ncbi:hypothetical protein [Dickeya phage Ds3CZ]|uniref:Uncharacterized protein n=9 Tax=Limestonevirus limestone TaxID=1091052 RepID=A0A7L4YEM7_9CAUD|nr:hypothetical protein [Dickeya phage XF4]AYN55607.1 hypothetical protein [Dickeya phage Kamild]QHB41536.1 hypothetical protein [Dickeya phage Ds5CZ]QHB41737.1 hypothetical protein [Dickeya phage Ds9CZ]QHB41940.1 hypothetical protein [Dickeya phage Ds16CZ]QHB42143.1 hypothetical protein [Dickeya phage Ds20CZ]QHB42344.1 hypothetical protein [Dickeya phage Ds23CZ]QHB42539.1 hypothetical protein [Dickeya phage Ds25CZ]QHB42768.1 hypothetical protein [Dickeya phage Ds3CZ]
MISYHNMRQMCGGYVINVFDQKEFLPLII